MPSKRAILEGGEQLRFFASVPQTDFSANYILARLLGERGFKVKIFSKGKDIDGKDNELYLAENVELWFSDRAREVAEIVKQSEKFQVLSQIRQPGDNFVELAEGLHVTEALKNRIVARAFWHRVKYVEEQLRTVSGPLIIPRYQHEQKFFTNKIKEHGRRLLGKEEFARLIAIEVMDAQKSLEASRKETEPAVV